MRRLRSRSWVLSPQKRKLSRKRMPARKPTLLPVIRAGIAARASLDSATIARRTGAGSGRNIESARAALARAQDRLTQQKAERQRVESDSGVPLPTEVEGELNIGRIDFLTANAALEK